jgi:hypothetical protein
MVWIFPYQFPACDLCQMYLMAKLRYVLHRSYAELTEISNHKVGYCILGELIGNGERGAFCTGF